VWRLRSRAADRWQGLVALADRSFVGIEVVAYLALGLLLAIAALFGVISAAISLWGAIPGQYSVDSLLVAIDRMLLVLMIVEILHTVRASFRTGTLVCEPFLIVGLIASIRRILIITLQSSQASQPGALEPGITADPAFHDAGTHGPGRPDPGHGDIHLPAAP
jgi:uncharacterized membrane protein (DUF373 family)